MAPPYAGIVRVSQMGGRKADSDRFHADDDQVREVERYATQLGLQVEVLPPELNVSGGWPISRRPSLKQAIEGVEAGQYAGIIVAYLSRLTRSRSGLEIWDRVEAAGGKVHSAAENLDTSTPNGRFIRDIHLANAVREREEKGEAIHRRRQASVDAGVWMPRRAPYGYDRSPETRCLVPNEDAAKVTEAFKMRAAGASIMDVAKFLGATHGMTRWLLSNRVYLGEVSDGPNRKPNPNAHPPLVDIVTFTACQVPTPRPPRNSNLDVSLLAGIARCDSCGYVLTRRTARDKHAYACPSSSHNRVCSAPVSITVERLDEWVENEIARPTYAEMVMRGQADTADREQATLDAAQAELDAWIENVPASSPSYAKGLAVREQRVAQAEEALREKIASLPSRPTKDSYDDLTPAERNAWLRGWLAAVHVRGFGKGVVAPVAERVTLAVTRDGTVLHGHGEPVAGVLAA